MARPRLGIFGTGRMGRVHLEHLVRLHRRRAHRLRGDGRSAARRRWTRRARISPRSTPAISPAISRRLRRRTRMAAEAGVDAVVVASRTEDHARDIVAFARRGIPVLVEKPLANSIAEAAAIAGELGADADRLVQVAFQRHYDAATRAAAAWVEQGLIGSIQQSDHVLQDKNPTPAGLPELRHHRRHGDPPGVRSDEPSAGSRCRGGSRRCSTSRRRTTIAPARAPTSSTSSASGRTDRSPTCGARASTGPATTTASR